MNVRFTTTFETALGTTHTLDILDADWVAAEIPMQLGEGGCALSYEAEGTGQDRFEPLIPSNLRFNIIWLNTDSAVNTFLTDLVSAQEERFYVQFYQGAAKSKMLWRGKIVQDLIRYEDTESHKQIAITATCGLNSLKAVTMEEYNTPDPVAVANMVEAVMYCVKQALPTDLWANTNPYLRTCVRWFEDDMTATTIDALRNSRLKFKNIFWWYNEDGEREYMNLRDMLSIIAKGFGARVFMADGRWNFIQVAQYRNANSLTYHQYDKRYTSVGGDPNNDGLAGASIITTNATIDIDFEPTEYRKGNEWTYLPSIKEVRSTLDFKGADAIGSGFGYATGSVSVSEFEVSDVEQISSLGMRLNVKVEGEYGGSFGTSAYIQGVGLLRVRIGIYYLKADGTWTTTATNIPVQLTCYDDQYWISHSAQLTYITAAIPVDGDINVTWTAPTFSGATGTGATTDTRIWFDAFYNVPQTGVGSFTTSNANYQFSSVILDLGNVEFGDIQVLGTSRTLQIWNGSAWENSDDWQFEKTGTKYQFNDMLVLDLMRGQTAPTRKYMGSVFGDPSYFHVILRNIGGTDYRHMPMRCEYNTVIGEWRGEWVQIGYVVTDITLGGGVGFEPALKFAGSNNIGNNTLNDFVQGIGMPADEVPAGATTTVDIIGGLKVTVKDGTTAVLRDTFTGVSYPVTVNGDFSSGATSVTIDSVTVDAPLLAPVLILTQPTQQISATTTQLLSPVAADEKVGVDEFSAGRLFIIDDTATVTFDITAGLKVGQFVEATANAAATAYIETGDTFNNIDTSTTLEITQGQIVRLTYDGTGWIVTGNFTPI